MTSAIADVKGGDPLIGMERALVEALRQHYESARRQQAVRDRLFVLYVISSWISYALLWLLLSAGQMSDITALCVFATVAILGLFFLVIYLFQITNYQLDYLAIARIYEAQGKIHADSIQAVGVPNVFAYSYGRYRSLSLDNPGLGANRIRRLVSIACDVRLLGTDFWVNCVHIFFVSSSMACSCHWAGASVPSAIGVFVLLFIVLSIGRQAALALLLALAVRDFESRWAR